MTISPWVNPSGLSLNYSRQGLTLRRLDELKRMNLIEKKSRIIPLIFYLKKFKNKRKIINRRLRLQDNRWLNLNLQQNRRNHLNCNNRSHLNCNNRSHKILFKRKIINKLTENSSKRAVIWITITKTLTITTCSIIAPSTTLTTSCKTWTNFATTTTINCTTISNTWITYRCRAA